MLTYQHIVCVYKTHLSLCSVTAFVWGSYDSLLKLKIECSYVPN